MEYQLEGVNQLQVNNRAGLTFASGLRSMLRADPDVIMVGEIRDGETARIAVESALTGHLVLSTLHTNDAPSALTRLTEMGIEPFLSASALECVVAQRLVRMLCTHCKERAILNVPTLESAGFRAAFEVEAYQPAGCSPLRRQWLQGPLWPVRGDERDRGDPHAHDRARLRPTPSAAWRSSRACGRCATTASSGSSRESPRLPRSQGSRNATSCR